jgi:hypothetical protein
MGNQTPGEAGGRRKIGRDKGSPKTGDGKTRSRGKIQGSDVNFKSAGGSTHGTGGFVAKLIRRMTDGGRHS